MLDQLRHIRPIATLTGFALLLGGCASGTKAPNVAVEQLEQASTPTPAALIAALCGGRADEASAILEQKSLSPGKDIFWRAYISETLGHGLQARDQYRSVQEYEPEMIELNCDGERRLSGVLQKVALERLRGVDQRLADLGYRDVSDSGAKTSLPRLHAGLPPTTNPVVAPRPSVRLSVGSDAAETRPAAPSPAPPQDLSEQPEKPDQPVSPATDITPAENTGIQLKPLSVELPESHSETGRWYAHLASYVSEENTDAGLVTLEAKFPPLAGAIEKWQITTEKGAAWRLGVRADEWSDVDRLCVVIRAQGDYCRVIDAG